LIVGYPTSCCRPDDDDDAAAAAACRTPRLLYPDLGPVVVGDSTALTLGYGAVFNVAIAVAAVHHAASCI
jgi:hypothetical protein